MTILVLYFKRSGDSKQTVSARPERGYADGPSGGAAVRRHSAADECV